MKRWLIWVLVGLLPYSNALFAETAYISDRLYLGLYASPGVGAEPIKTLVNGTKVDILQRQGDFVFLRLNDGSEGWARAEFVTTQLPARLQLEQLNAELAALKAKQRVNTVDNQQLESIQNQLIKANKTVSSLRTQLKNEQEKTSKVLADTQAKQLSEKESTEKLNQQLLNSEQTIENLQQQISALQAKAAENNPNNKMLLKVLWLIIIMLISMGLGAVLGIRWLSVRIRKRFNGLKVW